MIDTVKWKVYITDRIYDDLKAKSYETVRTDVFYNFEDRRYLQRQVTVGKYGGTLTIFCYSPEMVYMEGSLPKILYGENVRLLYPSQLPEVMEIIETSLKQFFGSFPPYSTWLFQRVDMCYAYKLASHEDAVRMLELLTVLRYPRKSIHIYPNESLIFAGRAYSVKFYLKEPEFRQKDYKELIKNGYTDVADQAIKLVGGVLRYEISLRKYQLNQIFKKRHKNITYKDVLDIGIYITQLNRHLNVLFGKANRETMTDMQALEFLEKAYKPDVAARLFTFYKMFYLEDPFVHQFMTKSNNATTIKRNIQQLRSAGVGIPNQNIPYDFSLKIPNIRVVNQQPA